MMTWRVEEDVPKADIFPRVFWVKGVLVQASGSISPSSGFYTETAANAWHG